MVQKTYKHEPVEEFVFEDWLRDSIKGARETFESATGKRRVFDTSEFRQHLRNARKEHLLAMRSLLDSAIEWLDPQEETPRKEA
jgi:hypothetical protein